MTAVVCRSTIEGDAGSDTGIDAGEALRRSVVDWLEALGLAAHADPDELEILRAPLGTLSEGQATAGASRSERLAVFSWALGRSELPAYDVQADPFAIASALGFHHPREKTILADAHLRPPADVSALAATLRALHGRLRDYAVTRRRVDFAATAARVGLRVTDGDLELRGMPLFDTPEPVWKAILGITRERQLAVSHLLGPEVDSPLA
jgi:hypothetical protein